MRRRRLLATTETALTAGLAGCPADLLGNTVTESFERSYQVSDESTLRVENRNGPVTVRRADADELTVSGEKRAGSESGLDIISIDVTEGERFVVSVSFESGSDFASRRVELTVDVPDGVRVDRAATANGDVTVAGVAGDLTATTSNGDVVLRPTGE